MNDETVAHEISLLQAEETQDIFEALGGTLKAAKKRGIVSYDAPILLKGAHDKIAIVLLVEAVST